MKSMKKNILMPLAGLVSILLSGCASIVAKNDQVVTISTEPDGADVIIKNSKGRVVHKALSPTNVTLLTSDGYFSGETYSVSLRKNGYWGKDLVINSTPRGWYLFGNIAFGGLVGWFIVDPVTGAMYKLKPEDINETLNRRE